MSRGRAVDDASRSGCLNRARVRADHRKAERFQCGKQITTYLGLCAQRVLDTGPTLSERDLSPVHRKRSGLLGFAINASVEVTWSN